MKSLKNLILSALLLMTPFLTKASDWKSYLSYHNVTQNLPVNGKIYALGSGGLFTYVPGNTQVSTYSKTTGLSSTDISFMAYCEELSKVVLVYQDYNIDIITTSDSIINIPQYKNSSLSDKTINDITVMGENAYLATNLGVVVVNLKKAEYTNAYDLGMKIRSVVCDEDYIYALGPDGVYVGDCTKNLLDKSNWSRKSTAWLSKFILFNDKFYGYTSKGLYKFNTVDCSIKLISSGNYSYYSSYGKDLVIGSASQITVMNTEEEVKTLNVSNDFSYLTSDGTNLWASRGWKGLQAFKITTDSLGKTSLEEASKSIIPNSPIRNYFSEISYTPDNRLLVAGGALAYSGITNYEGTAMVFDNGKWQNFQEDSVAIKTGVVYRNITSLAQDPNDATHHFASSSIGGLYEFRNGKLDSFYNCDNSPIVSIYPTSASYRVYNRLTGAKYDAKGNLWFFNNQVDTIVRVMTPDKKWKSFYFNDIKGYPTFDHYVFDSRGWVWMTHRRWAGTYKAGIACMNYNGNLDNKTPKFAFCTNFNDQNDATYSIGLLYDVVFDKNDQLWISTDQGVFVLEKPTDIFSDNIKFRRPAVPRNDGTNYADFLLDGVPVKTIAVDGANRKWIGTTNNGLYLVAADGLKILEHYTAENSPLLSNSILSLAIRPDNGLVMIGTDKGLVSFKGDATEPATELKESNIKVFPNPVKPEYQGKIKVTGFTTDSDVKITSSSGMLITSGQSLGGTFVWNGCDKQGNKVATGIYYVIGSDKDGKKGVVAKILIVK